MANRSNIHYTANMVRAWYNPQARQYEFYDLSGRPIPLVCEGVVINDNGKDDLAPVATIKVYVDIVNDKPEGTTQPVSGNG